MPKATEPDRCARVGYSSADGILIRMPYSDQVIEASPEFVYQLRQALWDALIAKADGKTYLRIIEP